MNLFNEWKWHKHIFRVGKDTKDPKEQLGLKEGGMVVDLDSISDLATFVQI